MNRRNLLTAAAASVMLPGAAVSEVRTPDIGVDADLIAACNEYLRVQWKFEAYCDAQPGDIGHGDPGLAILDPIDDLRDKIATTVATTAEGHYARLRCIAFHFLPNHPSCQDDPDGATGGPVPSGQSSRCGAGCVGSGGMSTRRDFFAFTAGAVVAKTVLPIAARAEGMVMTTNTSSPDAELIAVCAEFDACEQQTCIIHGTGPDCVVDDNEANAVSAPIFARMHVLLDRMDELRATTPAGIQARAHSLALHGGDFGYSFDYPDTMVGRLLVYLMRDSAALGGSPASTVASPDADLMEACAAFDELERAYIAAGGNWDAGSPEELASDAERERLSEAQEPLVDRICELCAVTREGHVARARSLALWDAELLKPATGDIGTVPHNRRSFGICLAGSAGA